ncbi:MAG: aminodeoxychorismate/anthranilate synthase component II [Planctomycetota bacterium]
MSEPRVLVLDHRDSFVHLLADQIARLGARVDVVRADVSAAAFDACVVQSRPDLVVLSPGPGHPREAELACDWVRSRREVPTLGVCLGHQVIGLMAGADVERAAQPAHGESCRLRWHASFAGAAFEPHMPVARYHSLVVVPKPDCSVRVCATTRDGADEVVMAIEHKELPYVGVQFHPESVLTPHGQPLLERVLVWAQARSAESEVKR